MRSKEITFLLHSNKITRLRQTRVAHRHVILSRNLSVVDTLCLKTRKNRMCWEKQAQQLGSTLVEREEKG